MRNGSIRSFCYKRLFLFVVLFSVAGTVSGDEFISPVAPTEQSAVKTPAYFPESNDKVVLRKGAYQLNSRPLVIDAGGKVSDVELSKVKRTKYETWIVENRYIQATLLPAYGGRILSLINKTTGHETLYQNPVASAYGIGEGNFLHDWLQIVGGIFPTYGPEHGKAWNLPWQLDVVTRSEEKVTIAMRWKDTQEVDVPHRFVNYGKANGLEITYEVSLKAGRAALDTRISIKNPTAAHVDYEYWTNVSLAPGSAVGSSKATSGAEIVYPLDFVSSSWCLFEARCEETSFIETMTTFDGIFKFDKLRHFANWKDWGIFYAWPDMALRNFWGVINQNNIEGLIRIADNQMTKGMKIWTFGYHTTRTMTAEPERYFYRPFIELWAGNVEEFFRSTSIHPNQVHRQKEVYAPTVGLTNITHANDNFVAQLESIGEDVVAKVYPLYPGQRLTYELNRNGANVLVIEEISIPDQPVTLRTKNNSDGEIKVRVLTQSGNEIFTLSSSR